MKKKKHQSLINNNNIYRLFYSILFFTLFSLAGAELLTAANTPLSDEKPNLSQELFSRGEVLYEKQCSVCHGSTGGGDGKAAYLLYPKPRDFRRDKFRLISTTNMQATDKDLFATITRGMPGSAMPPWRHLSTYDRWALVYYVRYLSVFNKYESSGEITEEMKTKGIPWQVKERIINKEINDEFIIKIPFEPPVTPESLTRGQELFVTSCAGCHGLQGRGDGQQEQKDNLGYPVKPRDLTAGIFKGSSQSSDLYNRMIAGLPGSPMPSYDGAFTQEQIWDLIHFVQTLSTPEAQTNALLNKVTIKSHKISSDITTDPFGDEWSKIEPISIGLAPLWWRNERVEKVNVKVFYNQEKIAIYLSWNDLTKNDDVVAMHAFSDGVALQFSTQEDPPFFGMGNPQDPVHIWHWKSGWQNTTDGRKDVETRYPNIGTDWYSSDKHYQHGEKFDPKDSTAQYHDPQFLTAWGAGNPVADVEKTKNAEQASAEGLGTYKAYHSAATDVEANGVWKDGRWHVVFVRSLNVTDKKDLQLNGTKVSIAFAVWDGFHNDRNGQKAVSIWNELELPVNKPNH